MPTKTTSAQAPIALVLPLSPKVVAHRPGSLVPAGRTPVLQPDRPGDGHPGPYGTQPGQITRTYQELSTRSTTPSPSTQRLERSARQTATAPSRSSPRLRACAGNESLAQFVSHS